MLIKCNECNKEFKRINNSHLKFHNTNVHEYKLKFPGAKIVCDETKNKIINSNTGQKRSQESIKKMSDTKKRMFLEDSDYRKRVSDGTKIGMRKKESWEKFQNYVKSRDLSGEKNSFFGKHHTEETKKLISGNKERSKKISIRKTEWWKLNQNKTVEELYGKDVGERIRKIKSEQTSGEKNPAFGKMYEISGRKTGRYKGRLFRSVYEYFYYIYLESIGFDINEDVIYEPFCIKYKMNDKNRNYHPDFFIKPLNLLVEVKSTYALEKKKGKSMIILKKEAAEKYCSENGLTYVILTEKDFPVKNYSIAYKDNNVEWLRGLPEKYVNNKKNDLD